jgi:hypothetical protein
MFRPAQRQRQEQKHEIARLEPGPSSAPWRSGRYRRACLARSHSCQISRAAGFCVKCGKDQGSKACGVKHLVGDIVDCGLPSGGSIHSLQRDRRKVASASRQEVRRAKETAHSTRILGCCIQSDRVRSPLVAFLVPQADVFGSMIFRPSARDDGPDHPANGK